MEYPGQRLAMRPSSTTSSTTSLVVAHVEFDPEHQRPRRNAWRTGTEPAGFNRILGMRLEDALVVVKDAKGKCRSMAEPICDGAKQHQHFKVGQFEFEI